MVLKIPFLCKSRYKPELYNVMSQHLWFVRVCVWICVFLAKQEQRWTFFHQMNTAGCTTLAI